MTLLGPQSPPKLVRPFQEVETFDRNVSTKIHKNLVTKNIRPKKSKRLRLALIS
jgi:hypothetical protein